MIYTVYFGMHTRVFSRRKLQKFFDLCSIEKFELFWYHRWSICMILFDYFGDKNRTTFLFVAGIDFGIAGISRENTP